jgi:hypothetical protein
VRPPPSTAYWLLATSKTIPPPEPGDILKLSGKKLDEYLKTSLNGDFGQIICVGYTRRPTQFLRTDGNERERGRGEVLRLP